MEAQLAGPLVLGANSTPAINQNKIQILQVPAQFLQGFCRHGTDSISLVIK
jgi:hypothetical protein